MGQHPTEKGLRSPTEGWIPGHPAEPALRPGSCVHPVLEEWYNVAGVSWCRDLRHLAALSVPPDETNVRVDHQSQAQARTYATGIYNADHCY